MEKVVGLGSSDPEFKSPLAVELTSGGVDSACHPPEVGEISTGVLVIGASALTNDAPISHKLRMKKTKNKVVDQENWTRQCLRLIFH